MRIEAVSLTTALPDALRDFWGATLGQRIEEGPNGSFTVVLGWTRLSFQPAADGTRPIHHLAVQIPENQLEAAMAWLDGRVRLLAHEGSPVLAFPNWDAHSVYFFDPAGHVLEVIAHHGLPTASDAPFGPASLLGLAEVGLPGDVRAGAAAIEAAIGERVWTGGGVGFAALGDAWGRFILVPEGHRWLPTEVPAAAFPTAVATAGARAGVLAWGRYALASRPAVSC